MTIGTIIRRIVREALRRKDTLYLERELRLIFKSKTIDKETIEELRKEAKDRYDYLSDKTISEKERTATAKIFKNAGKGFAMIKGRLKRDLLTRVTRSIKEDRSFTMINNIAESLIGRFAFQARTITETALAGFDTTAMLIEAEKAGIKKFRYFGPPAQREFCKTLLQESKAGKTWTREEIEAMDNHQGLPVLYYRGGYNCRHSWIIAAPFIGKEPKRKINPEEIKAAKILYDNGYRIEFKKESEKEGVKQYDCLVDNVETELKNLTDATKNEKNRIKNDIINAIKQHAVWVVITISKKNYNIEKLKKGIENAIDWDKDNGNKLKKISVIINDKLFTFTKEEFLNGTVNF